MVVVLCSMYRSGQPIPHTCTHLDNDKHKGWGGMHRSMVTISHTTFILVYGMSINHVPHKDIGSGSIGIEAHGSIGADVE